MNQRLQPILPLSGRRREILKVTLLVSLAAALAGCGKNESVPVAAEAAAPEVAVTKAARKTLDRQLTVSSELVPFQEIDVYAKESGFVKQLLVDYGSHVRTGQVLAILEIPELEAQLRQDDAMTRNAADRMNHAEHEVKRAEAQANVLHLQYNRLAGVVKEKPGLVAQQEVDDAQGKDLAASAAVDAAQSSWQASQSDLQAAQARKEHDQVLFDYSKITAPFDGVVTQRYANLGTLVQAGTSSSTQAMPLVRISQDEKFRLVIPVPESYVPSIRIGSDVQVRVPSLNLTLHERVARFSVDVKADTRTMHTEVDVRNPDHTLVEGQYAEATLTLDHKEGALAVPLEAVARNGPETIVYVVDSTGKLDARRVTLGLQTATDAEILSGVSEGEMVVIGDRGGLKTGQMVHPKIVNATSAANTQPGNKEP
jgi:RND family efflux transporter MFP subunit